MLLRTTQCAGELVFKCHRKVRETSPNLTIILKWYTMLVVLSLLNFINQSSKQATILEEGLDYLSVLVIENYVMKSS